MSKYNRKHFVNILNKLKMSESKLNKTRVQPEIHKYPFEHTFTCPKCKEILLISINYSGKTIIPQVHYTCPKRHSGNVDLPLFFNLFHSSNQEIEMGLFNHKSEFDSVINFLLGDKKEIFEKYSKGYTRTEIVKSLNERKIIPPREYLKIKGVSSNSTMSQYQ